MAVGLLVGEGYKYCCTLLVLDRSQFAHIDPSAHWLRRRCVQIDELGLEPGPEPVPGLELLGPVVYLQVQPLAVAEHQERATLW